MLVLGRSALVLAAVFVGRVALAGPSLHADAHQSLRELDDSIITLGDALERQDVAESFGRAANAVSKYLASAAYGPEAYLPATTSGPPGLAVQTRLSSLGYNLASLEQRLSKGQRTESSQLWRDISDLMVAELCIAGGRAALLSAALKKVGCAAEMVPSAAREMILAINFDGLQMTQLLANARKRLASGLNDAQTESAVGQVLGLALSKLDSMGMSLDELLQKPDLQSMAMVDVAQRVIDIEMVELVAVTTNLEMLARIFTIEFFKKAEGACGFRQLDRLLDALERIVCHPFWRRRYLLVDLIPTGHDGSALAPPLVNTGKVIGTLEIRLTRILEACAVKQGIAEGFSETAVLFKRVFPPLKQIGPHYAAGMLSLSAESVEKILKMLLTFKSFVKQGKAELLDMVRDAGQVEQLFLQAPSCPPRPEVVTVKHLCALISKKTAAFRLVLRRLVVLEIKNPETKQGASASSSGRTLAQIEPQHTSDLELLEPESSPDLGAIVESLAALTNMVEKGRAALLSAELFTLWSLERFVADMVEVEGSLEAALFALRQKRTRLASGRAGYFAHLLRVIKFKSLLDWIAAKTKALCPACVIGRR